MTLTKKIKQRAHELGFELVGVAPVEPVPELSFYKDWIEAGYAGKMDYLKRNLDKRSDVTEIVPDAKSVIVCAKIYHTDQPLSTECEDASKGWISRYSWGDDYHDVLWQKLGNLTDFIRRESPEELVSKLYVDTGPVVDRVFAKYAGIGWFGKNTCIINQEHGSWFFLGELITNLELEYDDLHPDRCGSCRLCIDACPTDAILEPYVLDSRRCISYLTIELRDDIPIELREDVGNHLFGCDICQDVCPWNSKATHTDDPEFTPREGLFNPALGELAVLDEEAFRQKFRKSPVKRSKYPGFLRNVAVAMGNSGDDEYIPVLEELAAHEHPLVTEHAKWALEKLSKNSTRN